jgi:hypothetical protein
MPLAKDSTDGDREALIRINPPRIQSGLVARSSQARAPASSSSGPTVA